MIAVPSEKQHGQNIKTSPSSAETKKNVIQETEKKGIRRKTPEQTAIKERTVPLRKKQLKRNPIFRNERSSREQNKNPRRNNGDSGQSRLPVRDLMRSTAFSGLRTRQKKLNGELFRRSKQQTRP